MPKWFITEKETISIVEKLHSLNELSFYLINTNPYIRYMPY